MTNSSHWDHRILSRNFEGEGCCFADMDGDGEVEVVAGARWWKTDGSTDIDFRLTPMTWLPPWGGGDRIDPHAHLRQGGGPPQYRAATYDWPLPGPAGMPSPILSVGMHVDPIYWYTSRSGARHWQRHEVTRGGIYESAVYAELDRAGTAGLVTVPERPRLAWYEPGIDPTEPWLEHRIGALGGNWHGLGVGPLECGGAPCILTPSGVYESEGDIRRPWKFAALGQIDSAGRRHEGIGDVHLIHTHSVGGAVPSLFAASPHGLGLWRWDLVSIDGATRTYQRYDLETATSQLHALAVVPAADFEDVDAWVVTGKRWQAHGPHHDLDPAGAPVLFRVGIHRDPRQPPRIEVIDRASGVGLQIAVRRLDDQRMQIATSNKMGVHLFTEAGGSP
ncbi:hypothetical protein [Nocardia abscessus]|uniref:hypothetical protein n=1 Tax=Nocardia abscessus TaxID=120957 RepID=UPI0024545541|nr:hypothetical protein [Nocardia abscessus]